MTNFRIKLMKKLKKSFDTFMLPIRFSYLESPPPITIFPSYFIYV